MMSEELLPRVLSASDPSRAATKDVAIAPDGARYAACFGRTVLIGDWASGEEIVRLQMQAPLRALAFAPDGSRMACACDDGSIHLLDVTGQREAQVLASEHGGYYEIAWSPDGRRIAGAHIDPLVSLFDLSGSEPAKTLDPKIFSDEGRTAVAFSPDGAILASTGYNAIPRWSAGGQRLKRLGVKGYTFFLDIAFAPDASAVAAIAETEGRMTLHFWTADGARKIGKIALPGFSARVAWSSDSSFVAVTASETPGLSLWSPQSLARSEISVHGVSMDMAALAAHPARRAFIAGSEHGQLVIWEEHGVTKS